MIPTVRLIRWIALGSPLWLISLAIPMGWLVGTVYLLVLASVSVMDYLAVPNAATFDAKRSFGRFSLGAITDVHIVVTNPTKRPLRISMRDELPAGLHDITPIEPVDVPARGECDRMYQLRSERRGHY